MTVYFLILYDHPLYGSVKINDVFNLIVLQSSFMCSVRRKNKEFLDFYFGLKSSHWISWFFIAHRQ